MTQRGTLRMDGQTWRLELRVAGEPGQPRRRRSFLVGTRRELPSRAQARAAADRMVNRISPAKLHAGTIMPWRAWADRYCDTHALLLADHTKSTQFAIVRKHLREAFGDRAVHEVDAGLIQAWISRQYDTGASAATIHARFAVLRTMLRAAEAEGLAVRTISARQVRLPVIQEVGATMRSKAFRPEEAARIIAAAPIADATAYGLCLYLGLRSGEALGLAWSEINLQTGYVHVRQQAQDGRLRKLKTKASEGWLRAPGPLLALLHQYRAVWEPSEPRELLFADSQGRPWRADALRDRLHELLEQLGIPRRGLHALRHCCAYALAGSGASPEVLRRTLRHASIRTTQQYMSATSEDLAHGLEAAAQLVERAMGVPHEAGK